MTLKINKYERNFRNHLLNAWRNIRCGLLLCHEHGRHSLYCVKTIKHIVKQLEDMRDGMSLLRKAYIKLAEALEEEITKNG